MYSPVVLTIYYTFQIIHFFIEEVQTIYGIYLTLFLNHKFLKYVIVSHIIYIYIYNLEFNWV